MPHAIRDPQHAGSPSGPSTVASDSERDSGFHARLDGLELWDVVQMECLSGARRVIRIVSEGQDGFLFFSGGQMVHAIAGSQVGEPAAMRLLAIRNGHCTACEHPWPSQATIHTPWQGLLLKAAQAMDERRPRRDRPDSGVVRVVVVEDGGAEADPHAAGAQALAHDEFSQMDQDASPTAHDAKTQPVTEAPDEAQAQDEADAQADAGSEALELSAYGRLAWLDAQGTVLQEQGNDPDFSGSASYATRLAQLTGEMLGLGEFLAMECRSIETTRFVYRDELGGIVACQPKTSSTAAQLRKRLGL